MSARIVIAALVMLGPALTGCATTKQTPAAPTASVGAAPTQLCTLDALRWSLGFVPRATNDQCVTILDTVKIAQ